MSRFNVIVGNDFEIEAINIQNIEYVNELNRIDESRSRARFKERLAYIILGAIGVAMISAALVGLIDGSFDEVRLVWSAAALPLGYVLKAYFDMPAPP